MSAIDDLFRRLRSEGRKAFMPFVTAGDPDLDFTGQLIRELIARGSSMCEIGIPYSDPIADGPVIQASYTRALQRGVRLEQIFQTLTPIASDIEAPLVIMASYAIILRVGLDAFVTRARKAGIAGVIVPDLPLEEAATFSNICRAADFSLIQLVTPTTGHERAIRIAETSTGFLYYVSVTGITGERTELPPELLESVGRLRDAIDIPICIGFGINAPEHVRMLAPVADGLIVGSAIVRQMAAAETKPRDEVIQSIGDYASTLIEAFSSRH